MSIRKTKNKRNRKTTILQKKKNGRKSRKIRGGTIEDSNPIGAGEYGCVVDPGFNCENIDQPGKISKIMDKGSAENELQEYRNIDRIDHTYKYHIGNPTICDIKNTQIIENVKLKIED